MFRSLLNALTNNKVSSALDRAKDRVTPAKRPTFDEHQSLRMDSELLSCPVCYNVLSSVPRVLPCGHTFCADCLKKLLTANSTEVSSFPGCSLHSIHLRPVSNAQCGEFSSTNQPFGWKDCSRQVYDKKTKFPPNYQLDAILQSIDEWMCSDRATLYSDLNAFKLKVFFRFPQAAHYCAFF